MGWVGGRVGKWYGPKVLVGRIQRLQKHLLWKPGKCASEIKPFRNSEMQIFKNISNAEMQKCRNSDMQKFRYSEMKKSRKCRNSDIQKCRNAEIQIFRKEENQKMQKFR